MVVDGTAAKSNTAKKEPLTSDARTKHRTFFLGFPRHGEAFCCPPASGSKAGRMDKRVWVWVVAWVSPRVSQELTASSQYAHSKLTISSQ